MDTLDTVVRDESDRQIIAQACLAPSRNGHLTVEHGKGLVLMAVLYHGARTFECAPQWIVEYAKERDWSVERQAERVRADLVKLLRRNKYRVNR